jgi:putative ABC transport system ATP-binding protein
MATQSNAPALEVTGLVKRFEDPAGGVREVLSVDRLTLAAGEEMALVGESGCGKTTFLHGVSGILDADGGTVRVGGEPMTGLSEAARDRLRARRVGYVFQTFNLLPAMTALENVALGMTFRPRHGRRPLDAARAALERVGLSGHLHHRPHQLSVGQQQRTAIARALAGKPDLVLADEPTSNLDRATGTACGALLREFAKETGAALLVVTHDPPVLAGFARDVTLAGPAASRSGGAP